MSRRGLLVALGAALLCAALVFVASGPVFKTVHSNDEARLRALEQKLASLEARLRDRSTSSSGASGQSHMLVPVAPPAAREATEPQTASKAAPSVAQATPVDEVAL